MRSDSRKALQLGCALQLVISERASATSGERQRERGPSNLRESEADLVSADTKPFLSQVVMARTKQNARRSTGGRVPRKQLALKAARASKVTAQRWNVKIFDDRRPRASSGGDEYRVHWVEFSYPTWESRHTMVQAGLEDDVNMVDLFKTANVTDSFQEWLESEGGHGKVHERVLGANKDMDCVFRAIEKACGLLGAPEFFDHLRYEVFLEQGKGHKHDPSLGAKWPVYAAFLRDLNDASTTRQVELSTLKINLLFRASGISALRCLNLEDGVCLCAAYPLTGPGHCFTLEVKGHRRIVYDEECEEDDSESLLEIYGHWVYDWAFVRKFEFV